MYKDSVSGCGQASAPQNQSSSKSTQIEIKFPQSPSDWSLALSEIPDNWVLTPVKDKRPLRPNWQEEEAIARCDLIELLVAGQKLKSSNGKEWHCHWTGIGLRLGTVSGGVLAIDADGDLAEAKLQELSGGDLPLTPCWTSGKPGRRQLLYRISPEYWEKIKTVKIDCGQGQHLEFRWDGCQSVLPPSKHPETGQYHWLVSPEESAQRNAQNQELTEKNGEDVATAIAPDWLIEFLLQQNQPVYSDSPSLKLPCTENSSSENAPHKPVNELQGGQTHSDESQPIYPPVYSSKGTYSPSQKWTDEDWARSYLEALASWRADDYDQWVQVGMALQSVSDGLLWDWEHWSRQSSKYKPGGCERKWRSFKPSKGISIGSLAQWAKEDGWQSPFKSQSSSFQETLNRETSPSESLGNHSMRPRGQNTGKVIPQQSNNINGKIAPSYSQSSTHVSDNSVTNNSSNPFTNEQQDTLEQEQQLTLKEAVTRLIMKGVTGSDRQEALFYLSCQYHIPSQQLDRYWQQLAQELDVEQIKPEIITQVQNLLSRRNYRLDPQQIFSQEFAQLMNNCADAMPGPVEGLIVTLLATAASCVGTGAEVVVKKRSGYSQPCLIRTLLLGETGEMKSPLQKIILAPLKKLEKEALQQYQQELKDYDAAIEQGEKNLKRPQRERFMLIDCTPEEQIRIHAKSPRGFLVHHDEWGAYLKGFNKYRNGKGNDREIDLSEFNGDMYIRDRVNDDSIFLEKMAVSRSAGYQLSLMYNLIEQQDDLDGFLSRWLISAPPFPPAYKNFVDDEGNDVEVFQDLLYSLYRGLRKLPSSRYFLTLESRKIFQHWQHYLVDLMNAETHLSLKGIYPKLEAYTVRLALVLHLVEAVLLGQAPESTISGETMKRAVYLAQYFLIQNQWVYCRKNSETEGLSGFMAEIQQWATKTGGAIAARQVKNGIPVSTNVKKRPPILFGNYSAN
ncbi:DUF3987 domain-containing protein [Crocosphaera watsonii]|uniref:DNA primase/polymerase bifunctional N-terminal domain-containing protein n=1 Tax=Crocosphaera watsonii WH 8501 TaxID=165597 RepID=Q4C0V6_CROWT|nr:DUF3987 domain-containing protein [Crocosphaera watsonii]EAM49789.1 hypothetical protein CwatDRAFT_2551 [Crocosphaera watsonii WH 8501]